MLRVQPANGASDVTQPEEEKSPPPTTAVMVNVELPVLVTATGFAGPVTPLA
jgi:hypothetical protein